MKRTMSEGWIKNENKMIKLLYECCKQFTPGNNRRLNRIYTQSVTFTSRRVDMWWPYICSGFTVRDTWVNVLLYVLSEHYKSKVPKTVLLEGYLASNMCRRIFRWISLDMFVIFRWISLDMFVQNAYTK